MRRSLCFAMLLWIPLACAADKKPQPVPLLARPNQSVEIIGVELPEAAQKCENYGFAAELETMLRLQGVNLDQKYWVRKLEGGELCVTEPHTLDELSQAVDGEYKLDVGHAVRLTTRVTKGAPVVPDEMIVAMRSGSPWIVVWKGRSYLMIGITYDEFIGPNNARIFQIKEIKLVDPLARDDEPQRKVSFVRGRDDAAEIEGTMRVQAVPVE